VIADYASTEMENIPCNLLRAYCGGNGLCCVLLILFMLSMAITTFGLVMIFIDVLNDENPLADNRLKLFLGMYCLVSLTGLPICFFQVSLRRTIRRNYNAGIDSFLDNDNP
jgi:hypothetical protein